MKLFKLVILGAVSGVLATAQGQRGINLTREEERFLQDAAAAGRAEIRAATLALQRGSDAGVKRFAQQLVTDHTQLNRQIEALAQKKRIRLNSEDGVDTSDERDTSKRPTVPRDRGTPQVVGERPEPQTSSGSNAKAVREVRGNKASGEVSTLQRLSSLNGAAFDAAFAKEMTADHEMTVSKFEMAEKSAADADIKTFISKTLPSLRAHLNTARSLSTQ
jgi:putative membrane protein